MDEIELEPQIDLDSLEDFKLDIPAEHSNGIYIPHLSPSTINSFIERRSAFFDSKVLRAPFTANPAMARGTAVEHGINEWLRDPSLLPNLADIALEKFDQELVKYVKMASQSALDDMASLRLSIPGLVECAYKHFSSIWTFGMPIGQAPVNCKLPGVKRKITGFMDYFRPGKEVIDCKVSAKSPGKLSQGYCIQGAIYHHFTGMPVEFHFIVANKTPKTEIIRMTEDDIVFGLSYATRAAELLEELEECANPKRVMEICMGFPNLSSLWNYEEKRDAAKRWGITLK
jgi:hypothetical protein